MATQQQQQEAVVITMGDLNLNNTESPATSSSASKKKQDTLFGPNIGIVARGPEWTETREKAIDELTPDVVRGWIAKSKEVRCEPSSVYSQRWWSLGWTIRILRTSPLLWARRPG